ncbi:MAG: ABC transporter ATP-binding protein [Gemmataceae bacterium]|nr:ABC transporter ATP-binding protein [Gemmataceae bacterium]
MPSAISVRNLSKLYQLGATRTGGYTTLRESVSNTVRQSWSNATKLFSKRRVPANSQTPSTDLWALKDISLDIKPGEVVGLIGRNGAGKSTFLKVLSRITEPTAGRVELRGRIGSLLEVGTGFHTELTGRENIYLNGAIFGMSRREIARKFDDIVAFSEVDRFLDTPVKRYSSGMFVRLAFAVASHMEPEILLVDEVLAVGDAAFQKKCLGKMDDVSRSGRTVVFVSHNMSTILHLCEKVAVFDKGRLSYLGDCEGGVKEYLSQCNAVHEGDVNLAEHPNRRPSCTPLLGRVQLLNSDGQPVTQVMCGDPITIDIEYLPNRTIADSHVAIGFDDALGCRVFTAATYLTDTAPASLRRQKRLLCRLDELPLAPGRYSLTLNAGPQGAQWTDVIDQALWFDVTASDFYGNGKLPNPDWGRALVRSRWGTP